jgi:hypothetical protein
MRTETAAPVFCCIRAAAWLNAFRRAARRLLAGAGMKSDAAVTGEMLNEHSWVKFP